MKTITSALLKQLIKTLSPVALTLLLSGFWSAPALAADCPGGVSEESTPSVSHTIICSAADFSISSSVTVTKSGGLYQLTDLSNATAADAMGTPVALNDVLTDDTCYTFTSTGAGTSGAEYQGTMINAVGFTDVGAGACSGGGGGGGGEPEPTPPDAPAVTSDTTAVSSDYVVSGTHLVDGTIITVFIDANLNNLIDIEEPPATGPVVVSGGSWATAPVSISGDTRFLVVANDPISGLPSSVVVHNVSYSVVDNTPPSLSGVAFEPGVVNLANQTAVSFSLQGAETGTTASYRITSSGGETELEGGPVSVTEANQTIAGVDVSSLSDGTLTLSLTLTDGAENSSDTVTDTIQKDATAPAGYSASITPATIDRSNEAAVGIQLSNAEVNATYTYSISSSGGGTAVTGSGTVSTGSELISGINITALPEGTLTLTVTLTDSAGNSGDAKTATATKRYAAAPVITQGEAIAVSMSEDGAPNAFSLTLTATDANSSDTLSWSIKAAATEGEASVSGTGNSTVVSYVPATDFNGTDSFEVQVSDGALTDSIVVNVTVQAVNDAPVLDKLTDWKQVGDFNNNSIHRNEIDLELSADGTPYLMLYSRDFSHVRANIMTFNGREWESEGQSSYLNTVLADLESGQNGPTYLLSSDGLGVILERLESYGLSGFWGRSEDNGLVNLSLAIDSAGTPYAGYNTAGRYYVMKIIEKQAVPLGDAIPVSAEPKLIMAPGDQLYLTYRDSSDSKARVMKWSDSAWEQMPTDGLTTMEQGAPSLAFSADGIPYLGYVDSENNKKATVKKFVDGEWQLVGVAGFSDAANQVRLVLSSNDTPYLAHWDASNLQIMKFDAAQQEWLMIGKSSILDYSNDSIQFAVAQDSSLYLAFTILDTIKPKVIKVNEPTLGATLITVEDVGSAPLLRGVTLKDIDSDTFALTLTLSDTKAGTLSGTAAGSAKLEVHNGVLTLSGSLADVNASLASIIFMPAENYSGTTSIVFELSDGTDAISPVHTSVVVSAVDDAPAITGTAETSVNQGSPYSFTPKASDADAGTKLSFSITNKPAWANFDSNTGALTGTPGNEHVGITESIVISVSDGEFFASLPAFDITVVNVNDAPTISGNPATSVNEDSPYSFTPKASDVDVGATLSFSITNKPAWASFNTATGALTGRPSNEHVGTTEGIEIRVSDGIVSVALSAFDLTVVNVNDAPVFTAIPDYTLYENRDEIVLLHLTDYLTDADGDELAVSVSDNINDLVSSYTVDGMKLQMSFDGVKSGSVAVNLTATDGKGGSATTTFTLTVIAENDEPTASSPDILSLNSLQSVSLDLAEFISDEESSFARGSLRVSLSSSAIESGALKVAGPVGGNGTITVTSLKNESMAHDLHIKVRDNSGNTPYNQVDLGMVVQVNASNPPIELTSDCAPMQTTYLNTQYSLDLNTCFKHPDGGQLTFSYQITSERRAGDDWLKLDGSKLTGITSASFVPYTVEVTAAATGLSSAKTTFGFKFLNKPAPELTAPAKVEVNATGANTQISERQLLSLAADASVDALNEAKRALVKSGTSVAVISKVNGKAYEGESSLLLTSGAHSISWLVTGTEGEQSTEVQQDVWIWPQLSVTGGGDVDLGDSFRPKFSLTGVLPENTHPNLKSLVVSTGFLSESCSANNYRHDGSVDAWLYQTTYSPLIHYQVSVGDGPTIDFACVASLPANYINKVAAESSATYNIKVASPADDYTPVPGEQSQMVAPGATITLTTAGWLPGELVTITYPDSFNLAGVPTTPSLESRTSPSSPLAAGITGQVLTEQLPRYPVTPAQTDQGYEVVLPEGILPGVYLLSLPFIGENGLPGHTNLVVYLLDRVAELDPNKDSDKDGVLDTAEGIGDSNGNGIPDFLDSGVVPSHLVLNVNEQPVLQCQAGTLCALGPYAMAAGANGAALSQAEWLSMSNAVEDSDYTAVSSIVDFEVKQLPLAGALVRVVMPLAQPIPQGAVYRKFANGQWSTFVENEFNLLHSAPSAAGACPSPGSAAYRPGLNAGDYCIQLSLQDGGPNDADGMANGEIFDPGVLALQGNQLPELQADVLTLKLNRSGEINLLANDTDPDGDTLELLDVRSEVAEVEFSTDGVVQLTAPDNFVGNLYFSYRVQDSQGAFAESTLEVTVSPNTLPVGVTDSASTTNKVAITIDVLSNDTDADGDRLVLLGGSAQQGHVQLLGNQLRYVPKGDFVGQDRITYTIADQWQAEAQGTVQVTVSADPTLESDTKSGGAGLGGLLLGVLAGAAWRRRSYQRGITLR